MNEPLKQFHRSRAPARGCPYSTPKESAPSIVGVALAATLAPPEAFPCFNRPACLVSFPTGIRLGMNHDTSNLTEVQGPLPSPHPGDRSVTSWTSTRLSSHTYP